VATLFAFASYLGTLVVLGIVCFGFGRYDPKFGSGGSFVVMAVVFAIFLPVAALGFYLAKRGFTHRGRNVALAGIVSGLAAALLVFLCDWMFSQQLGTFLIPLVGMSLAAFASARLSETDVAVEGGPPSLSKRHE
jgi:hypothetical protein